MAATDEDALTCDLAQYYHILNWKRLPPRTAAVLAQGLPEDARIMRKLSGASVRLETALLARICDGIAHIGWMLSADGQKGRNRPSSILERLLGVNEEPHGFTSPAAFQAAWKALSGGEA